MVGATDSATTKGCSARNCAGPLDRLRRISWVAGGLGLPRGGVDSGCSWGAGGGGVTAGPAPIEAKACRAAWMAAVLEEGVAGAAACQHAC
eukprot:7140112-Alexandrium_andersonii.AAC.1